MFLHVSVILFTGVCVCLSACWDTSPQEQNPPQEQTPSKTPPQEETRKIPPQEETRKTPPGRNQEDTPQEETRKTPQTPQALHAGRYGQQAGGTHLTGMHTCYYN